MVALHRISPLLGFRGARLAFRFLGTPWVAFSLITLLPAGADGQGDSTDALQLSLDSLLSLPTTTASRYAQTIGRAPASMTVVSGEEIRAFGYRTLAEVLQRVRGFYLSYDRNYTAAGVRGFSRPSDFNNRLLILVDGHAEREYVGGSASIGTDLAIPMDQVERVEIVRGPGSAAYGGSAMFAVVNVILRSPGQDSGVSAQASFGSYGLSEGSFGYSRSLGDDASLYLAGLVGEVHGQDLYFSEFDDPQTNGGVAQGLDWDERIGAVAKLKLGDLQLNGYYRLRKKGVPTGAWEVDFNDDRAWTRDRTTGVVGTFGRQLTPKHHLTLEASLDHYSNDGSYPYGIDSWESFRGLWATASGRLVWDPHPRNRVLVSLEAQRHATAEYRLWDEEDEYFLGDFPFWTTAIGVQNELEIFRNLTLTLGARRDEFFGGQSAVTPRAALIFYPGPHLTVKALYGRGFRAPSIFEIHYEDPFVDFKASPGLGPEEVETTELTVERRLTPWLFGTVSAYRSVAKNLIDVDTDPVDELDHYVNGGRVVARGIELGFTLRSESGASGFASYALQRTEDEFGATLTNSPKHLAKAGVARGLGPFLTAAFELFYESGRTTVQETSTESFLLANVMLRTRGLPGGARASLRVKNLFDESYAHPGGWEHLQAAIRQDGRTLEVRLDYGF